MSQKRWRTGSYVDQGSTMGASNFDPKSVRVLLRPKLSKRQLLVERELSGKTLQRGKITLPKVGGKP